MSLTGAKLIVVKHKPLNLACPHFRFIPARGGNTSNTNRADSHKTVHPRVCGEHHALSDAELLSVGSSPRVRGTRPQPQSIDWTDRFIPACAGNTTIGDIQQSRFSVHPRVCGEHIITRTDEPAIYGSSPRVRGTPGEGRVRVQIDRFIPACAGNTSSRTSRPHRPPVHPRVCGEHPLSASGPDPQRGSSPRVRGTQGRRILVLPVKRFIPACAGNTRPPSTVSHLPSVHPRVCGEHVVAHRCVPAQDGSSPRVRGTPLVEVKSNGGRRFIPACAGNTKTTTATPTPTAVHPRVCGEHSEGLLRGVQTSGSSPRVRGTRGRIDIDKTKYRFIPACAGNTVSVGNTGGRYSVHPRVCGEHSGNRILTACFTGSSPRVRGTLLPVRQQLADPRFIPACAGNTCIKRSSWIEPTVHPRVCGEHV